MNKIFANVLIGGALLLLCSTSWPAATGQTKTAKKINTCRLPENTVDHMYDTNRIVRIQGIVSALTELPLNELHRGVRARDLHFTLEEHGMTYSIHVGPTWYIADQRFTFAFGDSVNVTGSLMDECGNGIVVAGAITKGAAVLQLRDAHGTRMWTGAAMRHSKNKAHERR